MVTEKDGVVLENTMLRGISKRTVELCSPVHTPVSLRWWGPDLPESETDQKDGGTWGSPVPKLPSLAQCDGDSRSQPFMIFSNQV